MHMSTLGSIMCPTRRDLLRLATVGVAWCSAMARPAMHTNVNTGRDSLEARASPTPVSNSPTCVLAGSTWSYLSPVAFEGVAWASEHECLYPFEAAMPSHDGHSPPALSGNTTVLRITSPVGCVTDGWRTATADVSEDGRQVTITFATPNQPTVHKGWVSTRQCIVFLSVCVCVCL